MGEKPISKITGKPSRRGLKDDRPGGVTWRQANKDGVNARRRELYAADTAKHRARASRYRKENRDKVVAVNNRWLSAYRARLRTEMIAAYGGRCACCSEATPQFLQLDHIHNDGADERRRERAAAQVFYARLKKRGWPKDRYQLLCANCNFGKMMNRGRCPHVA